MWGKNTHLQCVLINTVVIHTHAHTFVAAKLSLGCCRLLGLSWQTGNDHSGDAVNIPHSALSRLTPANPTSCLTVGYLLHFFS